MVHGHIGRDAKCQVQLSVVSGRTKLWCNIEVHALRRHEEPARLIRFKMILTADHRGVHCLS
jgi:hypothetical protein